MRAINLTYCMMCQRRGTKLFSSLNDRLFGVVGEWDLFSCINEDCGLFWLSPQPILKDIGKAYNNYYTHKAPSFHVSKAKALYEWLVNGYVSQRYNARKKANFIQRQLSNLVYLMPDKRAVIDFKAAGLDVVRDGNLLEIGCGSGDSLFFLNAMGWKTTGVEIDPKSSKIASERGLLVLNKALIECNFVDSTFDAIVMNHVIEHLHDPLGVLIECLRVLKVGGTMVMVTPNTKSMLFQFFGSSWMHLDPPRHLYLYNSHNLGLLAFKAGFNIKSIRTSIRDAGSVFIASRSIASKGSYRMDEKKSVFALITGYIVQMLEWFVLKLNKNAGEEIVITLVKL